MIMVGEMGGMAEEVFVNHVMLLSQNCPGRM